MLIGVCDGVVRNLFSLVPPELLTSYGVKKLFLVGSAKKDRFLVHIRRYLEEREVLDQIEADSQGGHGPGRARRNSRNEKTAPQDVAS
ncbi:hypothetical protein OSTOST_22658, partial [Ostertagia ostertagi]